MMRYEINITRRCNFSCLCCVALCNLRNDKSSDFTMDDCRIVVDEINSIYHKECDFTVIGGEPTEHPMCYDICKYFKDNIKHKTTFRLATNHTNNQLSNRIGSELGYKIRYDNGSDDPSVVAARKKDVHLNFYLSPYEEGYVARDYYDCGRLYYDCGIAARKYENGIRWTWCTPALGLSELLSRPDLLKMHLRDLLGGDTADFVNNCCKHCIIRAYAPPLAKDTLGKVSPCFKKGLAKLNEYRHGT